MTEYTPTTNEIRGLVEAFSELLNNSPYGGLGDTVLEQFDRWLDDVKDNAWARGYNEGYSTAEKLSKAGLQ